MKLSELVAAYGDDKVQFQNLDHCGRDLNMGKKGTSITFMTEQRLNLKGTEQLGLILWFDRETIAEIMAESKKAKTSLTDGAEPDSAKVREPNPSNKAGA